MDQSQSFRVIGTRQIVTIPVQHVGGQNVIYWESIEHAFPGVESVKNGDNVVPRYLQYFPGVVLDVVLTKASENDPIDFSVETLSTAPTATLNSAVNMAQTIAPADPPTDPSSEDNFIEELQVTSALEVMPIGNVGAPRPSTGLLTLPPSSPNVETISRTALPFIDALNRASKQSKEFDGQVPQQESNAKIDDIVRLQEASNANIAYMIQLQKESAGKQEEMNQLQKEMKVLQEASDAKQETMNQLQQQALDQQERMEQLAIDHHEEIRHLQIQALEHTKSANSESNSQSNIPHHIHRAKHEGYEINRPTEFFQRYGAYALIILKMLKFGITVAGVAVPALPFLISAESMGQITTSFKYWEENIELGVNRAIGHIDNTLEHDGAAVQVENKEALEGADLRKLETFLKAKDGDKVLGDLYRTVTDEGHVKWVCVDHYRENYQQSTAKDFQRTLDAVGGSFDRSLGRVEVTLRSRALAEQFFSAMGKARSLYELDIVFDWACTTSDLEQLEVALKKSTRVSILRLDIEQFRTSNLSSTSAQYGVLFRIKGLPNMRIIQVVLSKDVVKLLSIRPKTPSSVCKLSIKVAPGSVGGKDFTAIAEVLKVNSTLTTLDLQNNNIRDDEAKALAEALKTNWTVATLNLENNSIGSDGAKALAGSLKTNSTVTTLNLANNSIGLDGTKALAGSLKTNSTLTTLGLESNKIGSDGAEALAEALKTNSTLTTLGLQGNKIGYYGVLALSTVSKTNSALTISLENNLITTGTTDAFCSTLKTISTITYQYTLDSAGNSIGSEGAKALAETLKINSTVVTLNLQRNSIGDDGTKALAEALKTNSTVASLNLESNKIGSDGAKALAEALKINSTVATLDLKVNSIGDDGAKALAKALKTNSSVATLMLSSNSIGDDGAKALAEALKTNSTVTALYLYNNSIGPDGAKALAEAHKTNKAVRQ
ncbi:hypothetical protein BGZ72_009648 [Mortierella alpina]|nr:hypothetical protein BGZ72_009648 [Mortierella alpina]